MAYGPCMCGATDCASCGPAQGYEVRKIYNGSLRRYVTVNIWRDEDGNPVDDEGNIMDDEDIDNAV